MERLKNCKYVVRLVGVAKQNDEFWIVTELCHTDLRMVFFNLTFTMFCPQSLLVP